MFCRFPLCCDIQVMARCFSLVKVMVAKRHFGCLCCDRFKSFLLHVQAVKLEPNCLATRYAVGVHRIKDAERSQNPSEQLSWAGNEMASILREGESSVIEPPIAWAGLAMVHKAQHEIAAGFDIENDDLLEIKERATDSLKQVEAA